MRFRFICFLLILSFCFGCQKNSPSSPNIILWAWERPENLEFIDSNKVAVAFLAQTILLNSDEVEVRLRRQPLKVNPETKLIAVTRIETNKNANLSEKQRQEVLRLLLKTLELKNVSAIQIDFDVMSSEREFYRQILQGLRPKLPENIVLSMTALASWCVSDNWIKDLPVDEAVPMAFEMGADDKTIRDFLASGKDWIEPKCRNSYGISLDEPLKMEFRPNRKFYLFINNPNGWKKSDLEKINSLVEKN
ncbi:MAG: DUF3142 domain-containing protein [Pyrinomonadaceae bacterium]|nr:DUF3142 domain-containing protein [Pyrinomonadaceae bacterium]